MAATDRDLRLLKQKIDLLIDGYQILYMKLDQQSRVLKRMEASLGADPNGPPIDPGADADHSNVVRMSERFLNRVRRAHDDWDPDEPQPS